LFPSVGETDAETDDVESLLGDGANAHAVREVEGCGVRHEGPAGRGREMIAWVAPGGVFPGQ